MTVMTATTAAAATAATTVDDDPVPVSTATTPPGSPVGLDPGCDRCGGAGLLDPFLAHDGSPPFLWCDGCLGAADRDCPDCLGYGAVPVAAPCDDCAPPLD